MTHCLRFVATVAVLIALVVCVSLQAQTPEIDALRERAEQGDAEAQFSLGGVYLDGNGAPADIVEAVLWYRQSADQGYAKAQNQLGLLYASGRGAPQNFAASVRWYWLASAQGLATAQVNLGTMYLAGRGVQQDDLLAYAWFDLGASGIDRELNRELWEAAVRSRAAIELRLTPDQRAEAQSLSLAGSSALPSIPAHTNSPKSTGGSGTAFLVHPDGLLLTAHHVVAQATSLYVSCDGQAAVPAVIRSGSATIDLAVLQTLGDLGTESFLRLSPNRVLSLGDEVFTIGYPTPDLLGTDPKYTNGTVSALSGLRGDASFLQISVPIQPGNSGGPLINEDGEVVGVVVSTASAPAFIRATDSIPQNINWAVKTAFASVLFEPPPSDRTPTVDADTTVIERVTAATCLVRVTGPAQ